MASLRLSSFSRLRRRRAQCGDIALQALARRGHASLPEASGRPLILLLDLDETLVRPKIQRINASRTLSTTDFSIVLEGGIGCSASLRPGLSEFFDWMRTRRASGHIAGPWIYGQGAAKYIKPVLHQLDPLKDLFRDYVLMKDACTPLLSPWPWVLKSLASIPRKGETSNQEEANAQQSGEVYPSTDIPRMVLIDNNPMSCILHPENTLLVRDYLADGSEDQELSRVSATLDAVIAADADAGAQGDYASQLVKLTPGFDEFRRKLDILHQRLQEKPDMTPERPLKKVLVETWEEACEAKRSLLGLGPGEV